MPAPKKYPDELRERAVRLVFQIREERGSGYGVIPEVASSWGSTTSRFVRRRVLDEHQCPAGVDVVDR